MKKKLLFIAPELAPWKTGGIASVVQHLASAIAQHGGYSVAIMGTVPRNVNSFPTGYHPNIDWLLIPKPLKVEPIYHTLLQVRYRQAISDWIRTNPQGVIHFHILPGARVFLAAATALRSGNPLVLSLHDWPPYEIPYYERQLGHKLHWYLSLLLLRRFKNLVVNSGFIANAAKTQCADANVTIIPNGIRGNDWAQANSLSSAQTETFTILYWGAVWKKKGVDLLLGAFARLRSRAVPNARLVVVGDGPELGKIRHLASNLCLSDSIQFHQHLDHSELRGVIDAAHAAVFPSVYEGFGIAIMEAMACGKVVVTTALGGPQEFISDCRDGVLVRDRTEEGLAAALEWLANHRDEIQRIGQAAHKKATSFDWSSIVPRYLALYESLPSRYPLFADRHVTGIA